MNIIIWQLGRVSAVRHAPAGPAATSHLSTTPPHARTHDHRAQLLKVACPHSPGSNLPRHDGRGRQGSDLSHPTCLTASTNMQGALHTASTRMHAATKRCCCRWHASIPQAARMDYLRRPEGKQMDQSSMARGGKAKQGALGKHLAKLSRGTKQGAKPHKVSVQGNNMAV